VAKIVRKTAKIFGSNAGVGQIAQFGSLAAGSPTTSTDPAVIQNLAGWTTGWYGAVVGANSPAIEDLNAATYVHSYQIAYMLQQGIPEWDTTTAYFTGSMVSDGAGNVYTAKAPNQGFNPTTTTANWTGKVGLGDVPLGGVIATFPHLSAWNAYTTTATTVADAAGWVKCAGQTLADTSSPMNGAAIPNLTGSVFIQGNTASGNTGGAASQAHTHNMSHSHQWTYFFNSAANTQAMYGALSANNAATNFSGSDQSILHPVGFATTGTSGYALAANTAGTANLWTTGVASNDNSGTGSSAATGSITIATVPPYVTAVYLMRVK
jgi:hypothetical protein